MALRLFFLFTIVPALELWLLIKIGSIIGTVETIFFIILTGAIGANLARNQGLQVLTELNQAIQQGTSPARKVAEGLLILGGGLLLITPGVCTDIVGFSVMIPPFRSALAQVLQNVLLNRVKVGNMQQMGGFPPPTKKTEEIGTPPTSPKNKPPKDKPESDWDHPIA
jgi:UPF0716 protein FxsA